jgi:hypothetical protein
LGCYLLKLQSALSNWGLLSIASKWESVTASVSQSIWKFDLSILDWTVQTEKVGPYLNSPEEDIYIYRV